MISNFCYLIQMTEDIHPHTTQALETDLGICQKSFMELFCDNS